MTKLRLQKCSGAITSENANKKTLFSSRGSQIFEHIEKRTPCTAWAYFSLDVDFKRAPVGVNNSTQSEHSVQPRWLKATCVVAARPPCQPERGALDVGTRWCQAKHLHAFLLGGSCCIHRYESGTNLAEVMLWQKACSPSNTNKPGDRGVRGRGEVEQGEGAGTSENLEAWCTAKYLRHKLGIGIEYNIKEDEHYSQQPAQWLDLIHLNPTIWLIQFANLEWTSKPFVTSL